MEEEEKDPLPVRLKYYTTLILGLVSCLSCFIFFFMVPFFLEPSIMTLIANFNPDPVVCRTVFIEHHFGMKNCSWSSCREGCTVDQFECDRIYVDYMDVPFTEFDGSALEDAQWVVRGTPMFVNIKACGYPPSTNCTIFNNEYAEIGATFACHHSRTDPKLVIIEYSLGVAIRNLIAALIIPNLLTGVSLGILSYWWYPGCQKRSCQYEMPPDQDALGSERGDEEDGDDENDDDDDERETMDEDDDDDDGGGGGGGDEDEKCREKEKLEEENEKELSIEMPDEKV